MLKVGFAVGICFAGGRSRDKVGWMNECGVVAARFDAVSTAGFSFGFDLERIFHRHEDARRFKRTC